MKFDNQEHYDFFQKKCKELRADEFLQAVIYCAGMTRETREHWAEIYDEKNCCIRSEVLNAPWQTGTTKQALRLGFQLYWCSADHNDPMGYSVVAIFCSELAPLLLEAVKLRYGYLFNTHSRYFGERIFFEA